jgi:type I restriction enzyme S subunit
MNDWKEVKLGDYVESISKTFKFTEEKVIFLNTSDILEGKILHNNLSDPKTLPGQAKKTIQKGDLLFSEIRPANKRYAIVDFESDNFVVSTKLMVLRPKKGINNLFLKFYLTSPEVLNYLQMVAEDRSGSFPQITFDNIKGIMLYLPTLTEQDRIAEVLSSIAEKIDLLHRNNNSLEQLSEALFRKWFLEESNEKWEEITLGQFLVPKRGKNITKDEAIDGKYPVVAGGLEPSCYHNQSNTKAPVITISASGANAGFVKLYYNEIWSSDSSFIDETITDYIYFFYVLLKLKQSQIFDKQEGSAQPHIYPSHIMDLEIHNYPLSLIEKFNQTVNPFFDKISGNLTQIQQLETLRDTLLPKLMSGSVRVEN